MIEWALRNEVLGRLGFFAAVFACLAGWELASPRRAQRVGKAARWLTNLSLVAIDTTVLRLLFPAAAVGAALLAEDRSLGLLNHVELAYWLQIAVSVLVLDLLAYLQHVLFHAIPALFRIHMVHHADLEFDVTTGIRFHPVEIVLSMVFKTAAVVALGPPVLAVLAFEVLLNATSMFNHANVKIPLPFDRVLRWLVVTPDMHRVHHSVLSFETNSNFGFNFPWWDRFLGTYRAQPRAGHGEMEIGLRQFRESKGLLRLLVLPFVGEIAGYSFGRSSRGGRSERGG